MQDLITQGSVFENFLNTFKWQGESGVFSVKNAYSLSLDMANDTSSLIGQQSDDSGVKYFWRSMWRLPIPAKIRIFLWRLFHGALATGQNLIRRNVVRKSTCYFCGYPCESDIHLFISCWWTNSVLKTLCFDPPVPQSQNYDCMADYLFDVYKCSDANRFSLLIVTFWNIWFNRNRVAKGEILECPDVVARRSKMLFKDYIQSSSSLSVSDQISGWSS